MSAQHEYRRTKIRRVAGGYRTSCTCGTWSVETPTATEGLHLFVEHKIPPETEAEALAILSPPETERQEEERLERERQERIEDGEETEAETQIPMPSDPNGPHYCEGCERSDVPLIVGRIMPGATEPVEWCEDCIASMPRAERVTWGLPYYVIRRTLSAWQTADGPYFVRSNGMPGGAVWSPNRAMGAREFISPAAAEAVIVAYHAEGRWSVEEATTR